MFRWLSYVLDLKKHIKHTYTLCKRIAIAKWTATNSSYYDKTKRISYMKQTNKQQ